MDTHTVAKGRTAAWSVQLNDAQGQPLADTYTGSEPLALQVWPGGELPAETLTTSSVAWDDAAAGTLTLTVHDEDTETLGVGMHLLAIVLTDGSEPLECYRAWLKISSAPGDAAAPTTYCSFSDVIALAGSLAEFVVGCGAVGSLLTERAAAAAWTRRTLLSRVRKIAEGQLERHAPVEAVEGVSITTGLDAGPWWGASTYPQADVEAMVDGFAAWVDGGKLLADEVADADLRRANSLYALAELFSQQSDETYAGMANAYRSRAIRLLGCTTLRLATGTDPAVADRFVGPV